MDRQWGKGALSVIGISSSCAILIMGLFFSDIFDHIVRIQYGIAQREDITVNFTEPTSAAAVHELQNLPGVQYMETFRTVPVRFYHAQRSYDVVISGDMKDLHLIS